MMWLKIPWPYLISRGWWPQLKIRLVLAVVLHMSWAWSAHSFGHAILSTGHGNNLWSSVTVASVWNSWIMHPWIIRTDIMLFMLNGYLALNTILQFTLGSRHYGHNFLNHDTPSDCPKLSSCRDTIVFKAISRAAATRPFESTRRLRRAARRRHMIILIYNATKIQKQIIP